jgi:hypothetical protein
LVEREVNLGADVLPLQAFCLAVGGTLAVVGFLMGAMGFGHDLLGKDSKDNRNGIPQLTKNLPYPPVI